MHLFHDWGKWEQFEVRKPARQITTNYMLAGAIEYRQRKTCKKCGFVKEQYIRQTVITSNS